MLALEARYFVPKHVARITVGCPAVGAFPFREQTAFRHAIIWNVAAKLCQLLRLFRVLREFLVALAPTSPDTG